MPVLDESVVPEVPELLDDEPVVSPEVPEEELPGIGVTVSGLVVPGGVDSEGVVGLTVPDSDGLVGLTVPDAPLVPVSDAPELLGVETVPLAEPEPDPMPEDAPEVVPVPLVPHAASTNAHTKGIVHFNIKILLKKCSVKHEMPSMPKLHACDSVESFNNRKFREIFGRWPRMTQERRR